MTINSRDSETDDRRRAGETLGGRDGEPLNGRSVADADGRGAGTLGGRDAADGPDVEALRSRIAGSTSADDGVASDAVKELLLLETGMDPADLERPFLTSLPDQYAARLTLFEWLEFALGRAGVRRTLEAIEYYVDMGWISQEVAENLRDHVRAFRDVATAEDSRDLETADHVVSLVYVARLASMTRQ